MIAFICLLAVLGLGNCLEQLPTRLEIESSINRTIDEVERMVREDPKLPRLSRAQIVDILFNITSKDMDSYADHVKKAREQYQRALMVVLPYNSKEAKDESLKDLYTKAPMVQLLSDSSAASQTRIETATSNDLTSDNLIISKPKKSEETTEKSANHWKNHRHTYAEVSMVPPTEEAIRKLLNSDKNENPAPEKFSFNLESFENDKEKDTPAKPMFASLIRPRVGSPAKTNLEIVYSTSVTQEPTTRFLHTTKIDLESFRPTMPPTRSTQNVLTSDQWRYNAPPTTTTVKPPSSTTVVRNRSSPVKSHFLPTMMTESDGKFADSSTLVPQVKRPAKNPWAMENLRVMNENEKPSPVYVTPTSSATSVKLGGFADINNPSEPSKTPMPMREEVKDLLASIGLRPKKGQTNDKTENKLSNDPDQIFGTNFQIPDSNNVKMGQTAGLTTMGIDTPSITNQNTFENTPQDVKMGVNNLSPDVQLLFQRFGLQSSSKDRETLEAKITTEKPRQVTKKTFWNSFKPLPDSEIKDEGMKSFLARFGLGVKENRNEKAMKSKKNAEERPPSLIEAVPANMKKILENIGLITRSHRVDVSDNPQTTEAPELHVFKPHETTIDDERQRTKINELLDTVRKVQEGKADAAAVQQVAKDLLETTKSLKTGPDPLSLEEILKIYNDDIKNEIKRQQNPKELTDMATSENSEASSSTTTTVTSSDVVATSLDSSANSSGSSDSSATSSGTLDSSATSSGSSDSSATSSGSSDSSATSSGSSAASSDPSATSSGSSAASSDPSATSSGSSAAFSDPSAASLDSSAASSDSAAESAQSLDSSTDAKNSDIKAEATTTETSNLAALADSFGGSTAAPDPVLPTRRKTGLYFLVDWNTFLEVGEEGKDKVNLRFQPKAGDRTRFLPVTVP